MDKALKTKFIELWSRYFNAAELPLWLFILLIRQKMRHVHTTSLA